MKGKKCFGLLLLLSIIFGLSSSVFLESANAAILDVTNAEVISSGARQIEVCIQTNCTDSQYKTATWNYLLKQSDLYSIRSSESFDLKKGDIVEWYVVVRGTLDPSVFAQHYVMLYPGYLGNSYTATVSWETVIDSSYTSSEALQPYYVTQGGQQMTYYNITEEGYLYQIVRFTQVITKDSDSNRKTYIGNSSSAIMRIKTYPTGYNDAFTSGINISVGSMTIYRPSRASEEMNQKDEEDRSNLESQSSNIDSSSEDSGDSAESTGTTLLAAFSSFVGAITSASPSNCNIDMDMGNLDLGVVNLCQLSPPPGFSSIASIFLILFCVPLSIATARKVISLFRSFQ